MSKKLYPAGLYILMLERNQVKYLLKSSELVNYIDLQEHHSGVNYPLVIAQHNTFQAKHNNVHWQANKKLGPGLGL